MMPYLDQSRPYSISKRYTIRKKESTYLFRFFISKLSYPSNKKTCRLLETIYLYTIDLPNYYSEKDFANKPYDWYFRISSPTMTISVTKGFIQKNIKGPKKLVEWAVLRMKR